MKNFLLVFCASSVSVMASAQQKVVADKIIGIVGDRIILKSELLVANEDIQRQGGQAQDPCDLMDGMLTQKALVLQAQKDSIPVSDDEVDAELDQRIRYFIGQYGSAQALEQISGKSIYQLKEDLRAPIKEQRMAQGMRAKIVDAVRITPAEVKEYYEKIPKDSLRFYETELQLRQIVVYPKASRDIELLTIDELNEYKKQVESGQRRFETLASLYSDDPGSKDKGGQYALNHNDKQWDPTFLSTAFRLKEGQISSVIKTKFGYHIIQMVSRSGDDAIVRHILRIPQITATEEQEAIAHLDSIRTLLVDGKMSFGLAVDKYSDDETAKFTAGNITARDGSSFLTIDQLDKDMVLLMKSQNLKAGEYSKPVPYTDDRGKKGVRLVYLVSKTEPHRENLHDDYNRIAQRALDEKKNQVLQKWFQSRIGTYYIVIDKDYSGCPSLAKWQQNPATAAN